MSSEPEYIEIEKGDLKNRIYPVELSAYKRNGWSEIVSGEPEQKPKSKKKTSKKITTI